MAMQAFFAIVWLGTVLFSSSAAFAANPYLHYFDCKNCHFPNATMAQMSENHICLKCHSGALATSPADRLVAAPAAARIDGTSAGVFSTGDASARFGHNPLPVQQTSHNWAALNTQPAAGAREPNRALYAGFYSRYGASLGKVTCTRCHNPHGEAVLDANGDTLPDNLLANPKLLIADAGNGYQPMEPEKMCRACHEGWASVNDHGWLSHPLIADYAAAVGAKAGYKPAQNVVDAATAAAAGGRSAVNLISYQGKTGIGCLSCHGVHYADSDAGTADGVGHALNGGDGKLLRSDGAGRADKSALCQSCHSYQAHGDASGEQVGCLVCHGGHSYDPTLPNYFVLRKTATKPDGTVVGGLDYSSPGVLAVGSKYTFWNDRTDGTANGYCEKCHGDAVTIGAGAGRYHVASAVCTDCHSHKDIKGTFAANCTACHGTPPVANTAGGPDGLVNNPGASGSAIAGAHATHAITKQYPCGSCHANSVGSGPTHNDGAPQSITIGFSLFNNTYRGGTYNGQTGVAYDSSQADTTVTSSGTKSCVSVYCHGSSMGANGGTNLSPTWDNPTTGSCGKCHGATAASPPLRGSHRTHVKNDTWEYEPGRFNPPNPYIYGRNLTCTTCHNTTAATHVNGQANWSFNLSGDSRLTGATYKGASSGASTTVPGVYGQCTNLYCHSIAQTSTGGPLTGLPGEYQTPTWGALAEGTCGSCHNADQGHAWFANRGSYGNWAPYITSGSHARHLQSLAGPDPVGPGDCGACHNYAGSDDLLGCGTLCHNRNDLHVNHQIDVKFPPTLYGATAAYSGTPAPGDGYGNCANTYCHGNYPGSGKNATPKWGDASTAACGSCHGAANTNSAAPASGNHVTHAGNYKVPCTSCHSGIVSGSGPYTIASLQKHADGKVDWAFNSADIRLQGGAERYNIATGTMPPSDGTTPRAYSTCENLYCHSTVQSGSDGTGPPVYGTPTWGADSGCNGCHGGFSGHQLSNGRGADDLGLISGSHKTHLKYSFTTAGSTLLNICTLCHAWNSQSDGGCGGRCHTMDGGIQLFAKHANGKIDIAFYPVFTGGSYNGSGVPRSGFSDCSNTYCHSDGTSLATTIVTANTTSRWGSGPLTCTGCHGFPPSYGNGSPKANSHGRHNYGCNTCHYATTSDGTTFTTSYWGIQNHVNKVYTVSPNASVTFTYSYNASGGTCSNISCHFNKSAQWGGTVACGDCHAATTGTLTTGSHAVHLTRLNGPDGVVGSTLDCDGCHGSGAKLGTHTGHVNGVTTFADGNALAATGVCNTCHSPAGSYDGVNDAGVGAKKNWLTGIYTDGNLIAGKERWCVTCHDESPANSKADGTGVSARNMVGNNSTWGFYQTGHGADISVDCVQCHSTRMPHIDHIYTPILDVMKTTQNPNNYRFYVGKGMRMPYDRTSAPESRELCVSCHSEATVFKQSGLPADATSNFRSDYADGTGYQNLHFSYHREGSNCITCHDPHGTSAPRMTADDRIGRFRLITLNAGDGRYYELAERALWNSAANNHGGASTGSATGCGTCHGYVNLSAGASEPTSTMYQRSLVPISFLTVADLDTDGLPDTNDNCPAVSNAGQTDTDGDGVGDVCDNSPGGFDPSNRDRDYDGIGDVSDSCPDDPNNDIDGDGFCIGAGFAAPKIGGNDNCPVNANPTQADNDGDGQPDACDNCPANANADQSDYDLDGIGDACDASCTSFRNVWSQFLYPPTGAFAGLALDTSDNVYGAGYVRVTALPGLTYVGGYSDFAIVKYDKDGNLLAKAELGSPDDGWEGFEDVAVDNANGFVYATGYTTGSLSGYTNLGSADLVLAKYDANLNQIWAKQIATAVFDYGYALAIDASGNLYVGARISSQNTLVKYDPDGTELWNKPLGGSTIDSVAVDGAYVYAGGVQAGDAFVKQFGLDGTVGWSSQQGTAGTEADTRIVVTGNNVFVAGTTFGSFPGFTLEGTQDIFVLKLNKTDGSLMATTQFNAPDSQHARGIDADSTEAELYVTGLSMSGFIAPSSSNQWDAFLLSFDTDLNVLRRRQLADTGSNTNEDIAVSKLDGSIYMAGARNNSSNFSLLKEQKGCP